MAAVSRYRAVVSGQWLLEALRAQSSGPGTGPGVKVLDCSWYLPNSDRKPREEFYRKHIPGSSFFDIDECSDPDSRFDHTVPSPAAFSRYVGALGIGNDTHVVVYDTHALGAFSAPRVWWMFRLFGHGPVSVLDGGFRCWTEEGLPVTDDHRDPEPRDYRASYQPDWVKSFQQVRDNIRTGEVPVVDARSQGRYRGTEPEPRDDVLPGHFPGSVNVPFSSFLDLAGKYLSDSALRRLFEEVGVDLQRPLWASCGSGVTACHVALAAYRLGHPGVAIYDGSWTEWFKRAEPELIISQGAGKSQ